MASELTPAQRVALEVLSDGKQHGMSKRSSTSEGPARVNIRAGSALASLGLARIDMDLSPHHSVFANYDKIQITDAGRTLLAERSDRRAGAGGSSNPCRGHKGMSSARDCRPEKSSGQAQHA